MRKLLLFVLLLILVGVPLIYFLYSKGYLSRSDSSQVTSQLTPGIEGFELIQLNSVGNVEGTLHSSRNYDGKWFRHSVSGELPSPPEGKFYEAWLAKGNLFLSTGELYPEGAEMRIDFRDDIDLTDYNKVVVTLETRLNGLDGKPEEHIFEGNF
ncbi:MAG: hypothetical protein NUV69_02600 [Candidatus Curtissbacteria bacterium]|nr:hypothetical protein [Candidatus Curtissbacteria bacterium]